MSASSASTMGLWLNILRKAKMRKGNTIEKVIAKQFQEIQSWGRKNKAVQAKNTSNNKFWFGICMRLIDTWCQAFQWKDKKNLVQKKKKIAAVTLSALGKRAL